jgi:hypothetical protein
MVSYQSKVVILIVLLTAIFISLPIAATQLQNNNSDKNVAGMFIGVEIILYLTSLYYSYQLYKKLKYD